MKFKGMLSSVDFEENEITIQVESEIQIKYGKYVVIDSETFDSIETTKNNLLEALQEVMKVYNEKGQLLSFNVDIARKAIEKALKID